MATNPFAPADTAPAANLPANIESRLDEQEERLGELTRNMRQLEAIIDELSNRITNLRET